MDEMENVFGKKVEKLVYGKYRAIVKNIEDPEKLGRIKLNCPEIYGEDLSPWAWPCLPYAGISNVGIFFLPELYSGVWLEFEQGHITNPIWSGCWYTKFKGENELPQESQDNYGTHKIIRTKSGHSIEFYDKENEEKIVITDCKGTIITLENEIFSVVSSGIIKLESKDGSIVTLEDGKVSVVSSGDIELESKDGASIKLSDKVTIISPADILLQCVGKVDVT